MSIKDLRKVMRKPSTWNHATIPRYQIEKALEEYDRLRAALEWQPIVTAPRDGTLILLYPTNGEGQINTGYWWQPDEPANACWAAGGGWFEADEVSHWMPLPEAPETEGITDCREKI